MWLGTSSAPGLERAGKFFDGWFPTGPDAKTYADRWDSVRNAAAANKRDANALSAAIYLTVAFDDNAEKAQDHVNQYLERYYNAPARVMRKHQAVYAGPSTEFSAWLHQYVDAGAQHIILRFAGDHHRHLEAISTARASENW